MLSNIIFHGQLQYDLCPEEYKCLCFVTDYTGRKNVTQTDRRTEVQKDKYTDGQISRQVGR